MHTHAHTHTHTHTPCLCCGAMQIFQAEEQLVQHCHKPNNTSMTRGNQMNLAELIHCLQANDAHTQTHTDTHTLTHPHIHTHTHTHSTAFLPFRMEMECVCVAVSRTGRATH